jgi:DNA-binding transcriptional MocR family regulator
MGAARRLQLLEWAHSSSAWIVEDDYDSELSDQTISARAAQEDLWLWPLSAAYTGTDDRQGFILDFEATKADEMLQQVRRLRKAMRIESGYRGRTQSGH